MQTLRQTVIRAVQASVLGAVLVGFLAAPLSAAAGSQAKLTVTATILKHASLKVIEQPAAVVVTAADIERGYVDVPAPAQISIQNNSAAGYVLDFASHGDFMRQILVRGLGTELQLSPAGGAIAQPTTGGGVTKTTLSLGFRFILSESARRGTYAWPLRLSVSPS
jgi:hypothetical protein